jgi:hypothetical protein
VAANLLNLDQERRVKARVLEVARPTPERIAARVADNAHQAIGIGKAVVAAVMRMSMDPQFGAQQDLLRQRSAEDAGQGIVLPLRCTGISVRKMMGDHHLLAPMPI